MTSYFPSLFAPPPVPSPRAHRQAEAAATVGAPEFTERLLDSTRGVETLGQQQDSIEEEKRRQAVDHELEVLDTGTVTGRVLMSNSKKRKPFFREAKKSQSERIN